MDHPKKTMSEQLIEQLKRRGLHPKLEVSTAAGIADIVTDSAVFAVIPILTVAALEKAIPRVRAIRDALGRNYKAVIYGKPGDEDISEIEWDARSRGVIINRWEIGGQPGSN